MMTDEERTARQVADLMMFIQDATNRKRADILTIENYNSIKEYGKGNSR